MEHKLGEAGGPGERVQAVMTSMGKSLFWKDKALFGKLLTTWDAKGLATVVQTAVYRLDGSEPNAPGPRGWSAAVAGASALPFVPTIRTMRPCTSRMREAALGA